MYPDLDKSGNDVSPSFPLRINPRFRKLSAIPFRSVFGNG
jgi:hypothetical protein